MTASSGSGGRKAAGSASSAGGTKRRATATATRQAKPKASTGAKGRAKEPATPAGAARRRTVEAALSRLRTICLALPDAYEKEAWGAATFRVEGGKMFAMFVDDHHGDDRIALWCRAPIGAQEALIAADPDRFFRPPYVGPSGWIGMCLDRGVSWREVSGIVADGHQLATPRRGRGRRARA